MRKHVRELKELLRRKRTYDEAQKELESLRERTADDTGKKEKLQKRINAAEGEAEGMQKKLDAAKGDLKLLKEAQDQLETLGRRKKEVNNSFVGFSTDASKAEQAIKDRHTEAEGYSNQVKRKENYKRNAEVLSEHQIWIDDYFIQAMGAIEKQVFANINQDFDAQFQKWFAMLVEDPGKDAYVDENFTPIVEQDGYEQDVRYLSGGERTSVALAYRLALNSIVQKVSVGMRSNLLILDEPTDGFSKEQLGKVREILDELQCPQVIIVSHERELEGFADQIFRVEKLNGISKVTGVAR
jgi:exonuclease SbcC